MFQTITPIDNSVLLERKYSNNKIEHTIDNSLKAQKEWENLSIKERVYLLNEFVSNFLSKEDQIVEEITRQIGRPISQAYSELKGFKERADYMLSIAEDKLAPIVLPERENFKTYIKRIPAGVAFIIAPWNYPYLTSVNSIIPSLAAGNAIILKHSAQTPLCSEQLFESANKTLPNNVFNYLHLNHEDSLKIVSDKRIGFVSLTGSVKAGYEVQRATNNKFINVALELGGKDPAYVRNDADLEKTVENLVDGSFFNSGQSCCGIERIYVDQKIYDKFLELFVSLTYDYTLGNPLDKKTNLGPVVKLSSAEFIKKQIDSAVNDGAKKLINESRFNFPREHNNYLVPQVLINVNHTMKFMKEETFGPAVGIMPVDNEEDAIKLMNDSPYGLTASIWTGDMEIAEKIGNRIETGTFFMNRCDYLDPGLSWTGVKETGKGCSLSEISYEHLTKPKSFHLRKAL
ncbi:MAG: aldehyde dehydrogenase [Pelagibacteraceae bacterium]|nr:aldehyde dehydrogenase [Pelagibacteraceae bacterium]PPR51723.1 MAG: Succinate semialdehyde dehydrogenase [NAD(P)+] Sad [Alphaproteobacteria bacterium MarineAlpha5_Bin10]|tara:strand:- start:7670 stop:9046 length:1377 start_codon:yes stop_codon:yes gene_type:complete